VQNPCSFTQGVIPAKERVKKSKARKSTLLSWPHLMRPCRKKAGYIKDSLDGRVKPGRDNEAENDFFTRSHAGMTAEPAIPRLSAGRAISHCSSIGSLCGLDADGRLWFTADYDFMRRVSQKKVYDRTSAEDYCQRRCRRR